MTIFLGFVRVNNIGMTVFLYFNAGMTIVLDFNVGMTVFLCFLRAPVALTVTASRRRRCSKVVSVTGSQARNPNVNTQKYPEEKRQPRPETRMESKSPLYGPHVKRP